MSRRKHLAARSPSGRLKPATHLLTPTQIRRLLDFAASEVRHAAFGTQLGRCYLSGQVSATEFAAGKRWAEIVANYSQACRSPPPPRTVSFEAGLGRSPDSESNEFEVRLHECANAAFLAGRHALRSAGSRAEQVVDRFASVTVSRQASTISPLSAMLFRLCRGRAVEGQDERALGKTVFFRRTVALQGAIRRGGK